MIDMTRMFSDSPRHAGTEAAHAAHDQVDLNAFLRSPVQSQDQRRIDEGVHLGDDASRIFITVP